MDTEEHPPWFPATPDREILFEFDGRDLKVMVMLSIQKHADDIKRNFSPQEVKLLVHLLTDSEESEPEPEPEESSDEDPEDSEPDEGEPESGDEEPGEEPGDSGDDGPDENGGADDPYYDEDWDEDDSGDEDGEEAGTVAAGDGEAVPDGPWTPGEGTPPKREQKDYPDDILAALAALGLDPSTL